MTNSNPHENDQLDQLPGATPSTASRRPGVPDEGITPPDDELKAPDYPDDDELDDDDLRLMDDTMPGEGPGDD
ncbi:hypothetical protein CR152_25955 [Massilia violaceinigra]|uniref:Uncharacterized protein n=1 Tax=Massilia violaceinigra TaxID=2045208 RepID=A0A2D2DRF3_9BURK|nr:hypothetical protein [Massilia violaceinigra]ATQ77561.1 hypothetical protein CR152_25955 [Massilia violaceinigra]